MALNCCVCTAKNCDCLCDTCEAVRRMTMNGTDWAYGVLLKLALDNNSYEIVRQKAAQFRKEVLTDCQMKANVDMDWYPTSHKYYAFIMVYDICMELTK